MQKYYSQADIISMLTFIGHPNRNAVGRLFKLPKNSRKEKIDEYSKIFSYREICKTLRVGLLGLPERFLTIEDVMYLLNVDRGTVLLLIDKGFLKIIILERRKKGEGYSFTLKRLRTILVISHISFGVGGGSKMRRLRMKRRLKEERS